MDNAYTDSSYYLGSWSCKYASGDAAKLCEFTGNVSSCKSIMAPPEVRYLALKPSW